MAQYTEEQLDEILDRFLERGIDLRSFVLEKEWLSFVENKLSGGGPYELSDEQVELFSIFPERIKAQLAEFGLRLERFIGRYGRETVALRDIVTGRFTSFSDALELLWGRWGTWITHVKWGDTGRGRARPR